MKKTNGLYYSEQELNKIFYNVNGDKHSKIYLPNELFEDLINNEHIKANVNHLAFAFSYVYLISYLYRYANYEYEISGGHKFVDEQTIYKILNTSPSSRGKNGLSYLTKKSGLLEQMGYIRKSNDFPVIYKYIYSDPFTKKDIEFIDFIMNSEIELPSGYPCNSPNIKVSHPIKGLFFDRESESEHDYNGYFYDVYNTTLIPIQTFIFCMANKDIGTIGFYVYCYIKSRCGMYQASFNRSIEQFCMDLKIGKTKLCEVLGILEKHNMITNSHNPFVIGLPHGVKVPANSYTANNHHTFKTTKREIVPIRRIMNYEKYDKEYGIYLGAENMVENNLEIVLPF